MALEAEVAARPKSSARARRDAWFAWALLTPTLLPLAAFILYPSLRSLYLSFFDFNAFMTRSRFVGFDNYQLLFVSPDYWQSLGVTLAFVLLTAVPSVLFALAVATALDLSPYLRGLLRTVFLMPVAVSSAMAAMLWIFIYNPSSGYLNFMLERLGIAGPNWLGDPSWALFAVSITTVWKEIGFNVIFILAGLASVPDDLREAASLDGAGAAQVYRHVTLPILSPTLFFVSVVSVLNSFQSFGQIHILTGGGPAGTTTTLVYNLYRDAFQNFQTGPASAQAVVLFIVMLIGTGVQFRIARSRVHYR
jgi:sn-glycerol 3-phosphate transport system permease protein